MTVSGSDHATVSPSESSPFEGFPPEDDSPRSALWRIPMALAAVGFVAFWTWALFFASKESINRVEDREWAARAEAICVAAQAQRHELQDLRRFDPNDPESLPLLAEFADNIDRATAIVEQMLDDVVAVPPTDAKGQEIVPLWEADYRAFLEDRRMFTAALRAGELPRFTETRVDRLPISEKVATFAVENEMNSCVPPNDIPA